jgi:hypothetical protein
MTDLEDRLGALRDDPTLRAPLASPSVGELRARAGQRRRRRHLVIGATAIVPIALLAVSLAVVARDEHTDVVTGPPPTEAEGETAQIVMGDVIGVTLRVTPDTGLRDGDIVDVKVDGLEQLPNAAIVMCAGDVTAETAINACDFASATRTDALEPGNTLATGNDRVSVPRFIDITRDAADPNVAEPYDCATELAGCVLAVGPISLPARGVAVPLQFVDEEVPVPTIATTPSTGLTNGQTVTVSGEGLPPNAVVALSLCREATYDDEGVAAPVCDEYGYPSARTDGSGRVSYELRAWATLYSWTGPTDCTVERCIVVYRDGRGEVAASARLEFAAGSADRPQLSVTPAGPYTDQQVVTVTGTGFRPGIDIGDEIAQCPNDKDTALEERCGRSDISSRLVADDGTFTMQYRLTESLIFTGSCKDGPGCHLGWVILHGPTLAKVPITFR